MRAATGQGAQSYTLETNTPLKRVLVLHSFGRDFAPINVMAARFRTELARHSPWPVEFHEASIEAARFGEGVNEKPVVDYLRTLFTDRHLDLVVAMGAPATLFVSRHRDRLFPEVPLLATMDKRRLPEFGVPANTILVPLQLNLPWLIEDILQVLPSTTNIVVVAGVSPLERYWSAEFLRDCAPFTNRVTFTALNNLSLEAICRRTAALPPNTAIFFGIMLKDAANVPHEQESALVAVRATANAPIFGLFEHQLGLGIVGGRLTSNDEWGRRAAEAALRILNGEPPGQLRLPPTVPGTPLYDWRELRRWKINDLQLPPGSEVRYRQPTLWEQHKWQLMAIAAVCAVESALVVALLVQSRRRRAAEAKSWQAERESQRCRDELAHFGRVSTMGQIASTLAHELSQPLGAILTNVEAAELYLQQHPPDYDSLRSIVTDIRKDDQRARAVIDRVRSLLKRRALELEPLSLKELLDQIAALMHAELQARRVRLKVELSPNLPLVRADRVQLQQVLLNLLVNGADAMNDLPPEHRQLSILAHRNGQNDVELAVSDSGHGIPEDKLPNIFDPFFSTKSNGLGMGLAISETIIKTHGGRIWAENNPTGGATFRFTLDIATSLGRPPGPLS
jgi:signal transduction histidine kinase